MARGYVGWGCESGGREERGEEEGELHFFMVLGGLVGALVGCDVEGLEECVEDAVDGKMR